MADVSFAMARAVRPGRFVVLQINVACRFGVASLGGVALAWNLNGGLDWIVVRWLALSW